MIEFVSVERNWYDLSAAVNQIQQQTSYSIDKIKMY